MRPGAKYLDSPPMREALKRYIRAQMTLKNVRYADLSNRLKQYGIKQDHLTLTTKINRGNYGAQLFMFILMALEVENIQIPDIESLFLSVQREPKSKGQG